MPLRVLSVAFPFAPVGSCAVGGAEQILSDLDEALVAAGHQSLVVACQGSQSRGELFAAPLPDGERLDAKSTESCRAEFQAAIDRALRSHDVDLIHMHGMDFDQYGLPEDIPVIVTLHMPIDWYPAGTLERYSGRVLFVCVSESQRETCPELLRKNVIVMRNGVALPTFTHAATKQDYAVALGRICPEKNFHEALQAGTLAKTRVLVGGQVFPYEEHQRYFDETLRPLLQSPEAHTGHEFLGPLEAATRQEMLAHARCLLHPTLAPETSSLVAMEAMAAGTPVIAYRSGALNEIVDDGSTGFLVNSVGEMAEAIGRAHTISPHACRAAAESRFARESMIQRYFKLYEKIAQTQERAYA